MKNILKRISAYLIDIIIISTVVTLLTSIDKINFQYNNYQKYYKEYAKVSEKYTKVFKKQANLEQKYKEKDIKKSEYKVKKEKLNTSIKSYEKQIKKLQYNISRNSIIYYIVYIAFALGYFGIFQASFNGQTLGKKIMKLKVVNKAEEPAKLWQFLFRSFILLNLWMYIANIVFVYTLNVSSYYMSSLIINEISRGIQLVTLLLVVMSKNGRGLHDYASSTKVIYLNQDGKDNDSNVIEAEIVDKKKKGGK